MVDKKNLTGIYLQTLRASSSSVGEILDFWLENALRHGPWYRVIVHESPEWHALLDRQEPLTAFFNVDTIDQSELQRYRDITQDFLEPILGVLPNRIHGFEYDEPKTQREIVHHVIMALTTLQIGCQRKVTISLDRIHLAGMDRAMAVFRHYASESGEGDVQKRVSALSSWWSAYSETNLDSLRFKDASMDASARMEVLDDELLKSASASRHRLSIPAGPLRTRRRKLARDIRDVAQKWVQPLALASDAALLFDGPDAQAGAWGPLLHFMDKALRSLNLDTFVPAYIDDSGFRPTLPGATVSIKEGWYPEAWKR